MSNMSNVFKKQSWSILSLMLMIFVPFIGAATVLSIAGIYYKKGGKNEVIEYITSILKLAIIPSIMFGLVVLIFCL